MSKKELKFSVNQLIVDGQEFDISAFVSIEKEGSETQEITHMENKDTEVVSIKKFTKNVTENRFVAIYINEGEKFPYSTTVIDSNDPKLGEQKNPRPPEQIELDNQFFVLIDQEKQRIFMSDQRRKKSLIKWLSEKTEKDILMKSIIEEEKFIEKIQSINKISFSVAPTLWNSANEDILSNNLVKDIHGFGAEKANIELIYKNGTWVTDAIVQKFNSLIGKKDEFDDIVVIGRSDENFESIFNLHEIISKISIEVEIDTESKKLDPEGVFSSLIEQIKEHEKNN